MKTLRLLILYPFSLLLSIILIIRHKLYDWGIFKSCSFQIPTIVIGNLAIGGAGKSPMTEFLIRSLENNFKIAVLSRGYGRKTKGFRYVQTSDSSELCGDEPLQFKNKFPHTTIAVSENRCHGIEQIKGEHDLIILDDAYQHRALQPKINILLFEYSSLLQPIRLFPTGRFRDLFSQTSCADFIIVTKSPSIKDPIDKEKIEKKLRGVNQQARVFYASIKYHQLLNPKGIPFDAALENYHVLAISGIANPKPFVADLKSKAANLTSITFPDHHNFTIKDIQNIRKTYHSIQEENKIIVTTEKDFQRLPKDIMAELPVYFLPISTDIEGSDNFLALLNKAIKK